MCFFFSSRRRHTRCSRDWSSDVCSSDLVWVTANFKETQLAKMRPGQKAEVKVDTYGKTFTGRVDSIAGTTGARLSLLLPENATGNFVKVVQRIPVKIMLDRIPSEKAILRPGMNVDATILTR